MPSTSRQSPNATIVTSSAIDEAAEALNELPEKAKEKLSLREAVDVLRDQITAALDKGYSYEDIAAMLEKQDITIAPSSLKHYLARSNRQLKSAGGTQTRRRRTTTEQSEPESEQVPEPVSAIEAEAEVAPAPKRRGRRPASESAPAAAKTRSAAARTKSVSTGARRGRS
ncbi:hypothetical protein [Rivularia sp. UHCC 0363]|uniref:hypothetical protein n=1 Tax=Rivularia sp. UHCC 0363 TaxID=3110244 RepID=UPI002B1EFA85|nr:hypothetical protein [Rivularia sp. UHCC 0363]MEA5599124.1 hypothetical protein [Rivularia sp. UHCC 0363]